MRKQVHDRTTKFPKIAKALEDQLSSVASDSKRAITEREEQHTENLNKAAQGAEERIREEENYSISGVRDQGKASLERIREAETTGNESLSRSVDEFKEGVEQEFDSLKQAAEAFLEELRAEIENMVDQRIQQRAGLRRLLSRLFRGEDSS